MEQAPLARTLVELSGAVVDEVELFGWLDRLARRGAQLLDADAAGVMVTDHHGELAVVAATDESAELRELLRIQSMEGPGIDSFRSSDAASCANLSTAGAGWTRFTSRARAMGFHSVYGLPMRVGSDALGALTLFYAESAGLGEQDLDIARAFADLAAIGVLHERSMARRDTEIEQLKVALNSRVLIEQAKGVLAERHLLDVDQAFSALRSYARSRNLRLHDVARDVVDHNLVLNPIPGSAPDRDP